MKRKYTYFFWILMLAFGLMLLVFAAQVLTRKNITVLQQGNRDAVITFTINNRLQELVNLSFDLNATFTNPLIKPAGRQSLVDSLNMLGYNAEVLASLNLKEEASASFVLLKSLVNKQMDAGLTVLKASSITGPQLADSLRQLHLADSVYSTALSIQRTLENELQATMNNNTKASARLFDYNRVLAIIAIGAILILGTIIINRNLRQVQLIRQLEKTTEETKRLASVKEQFLANMSHEIRTPLNAIKGFGELMRYTSLNKEQNQYLNIINNAAGNLLYIVNDILDISKIEAGKLKIESKDFSLYKILQTLQEIFGYTAMHKKLHYEQIVSPEVPMELRGDPERLKQILINLVSNGIKFTEEGFVSVHIKTLKQQEGRFWLEFTVEDSGIGIPPDKTNLIFQRFEQLDTPGDMITKGTGLGLSIVHSLAEMMGGTVAVSSEKDKGSLFRVTLPFEKAMYPVSETASEIINTISEWKEKKQVLLVEDNQVNQLLMKKILEQMGIYAQIAENGKAAVEAINQNDFDLIFLDIQMPVMDGYKTISIIRNQLNKKTPVIAMTAYAMPGEKEKCIKNGMDDYIAKPVDMDLLRGLLVKYLGSENKQHSQNASETANSQFDYLLQLTGGDKLLANKIIKEIKDQVPDIIAQFRLMQQTTDFSAISSLCHYMISTFSPLGPDSGIMQAIKKLQHIPHENFQSGDFKEIINIVISQLDKFSEQI
jgi:signal transduction histidine kinase/response regulator of citrate/malate metabolism